MKITPKTFITFFVAFFLAMGWNVFLIQRDNKLFEAAKSTKAKICTEQPSNPDCKFKQ